MLHNGLNIHHLTFFLLILLIAVLSAGALPRWPYSRTWGMAPFVGIQIIVLLSFLLWLLNGI